MKKKTLITIISLVLVAALLSTSVIVALSTSKSKLFGTIAQLTDDVEINATISSSFAACSNLSANVQIDSTWTTLTGCNLADTSMNADAARFSFLMALDALDIARVNLAGGTNTSDTNNTAFPLSLGFEGCEDIMVTADRVIYRTNPSKSYSVCNISEAVNTNDTTRFVISYSTYNDGCSETTYYVNISFDGTSVTDVAEWVSNFDIGSTNSNLYKTSTSDWVVKANHKGFDVAATRAINAIFHFLEDLTNPSETHFIFNLNGYSRGAALANIIATRLENEFSQRYTNLLNIVNCYTFATPLTTTAAYDQGNEGRIFNFVSADDVITKMPPASLGFRRYGTDYSFTLSGDDNAALRDQYYTYSTTAFNINNLSPVLANLEAVCTSRDNYYKVDTTDSSINKKYSSATLELATAERDRVFALFNGLCPANPEMYFNISEVALQANGTYAFTLTVAPSFVGLLLPYGMGATLSDGSIVDIQTYGNELFGMSRYTKMLISMFSLSVSNPTCIMNMHLPCQYLVYLDNLD